MATASLSISPGTQMGNFTVIATIDISVTGVDKTDFNVEAVSGNGITGVDYSVMGAEPGTTFNLLFELPESVEGSLRISFTGEVTPEGSSTPESVTAEALVVFYDNTTAIGVVFGEVEYRDGGIIALPLTFSENVIADSKTVFPVSHVSGDNLDGVEYYIVGEDTAYELVFIVPSGRSGSFSVGADGYVVKENGVWDNVVGVRKLVPFNTT